MPTSELVEKYFKKIEEGVRREYVIANNARAKKLDPVDKVEIPLAMSMAEKSVGLISTIYPQLGSEVSERILELEKEYGQLDPAVSFKIAEEVAKEKFCKFDNQLQAIDAGVRVGFAYTTLGVVASPIEGFTEIKLGKTAEGKDYFMAYFSGPIRSAGTTATCIVLMIIDYLREIFGYAKYDPTEEEVRRYVTENFDYHERVNNLQYLPTEEEIVFLAKNLPIQIAGDPTEKREVSNYKDLKRVDTDFIRGGMCLTFSEGLAQKAAKGWRLLKSVKDRGFQSTGWDFLPDYLEIHKKREKGTGNVEATYIKDLVAGRPVYGHPSRSGGFRFRYGRSRVAGFSAVSVHPATMGITNDFLSSGTQLKIEKPTKGCILTSCDEIDGPVVKFRNGSVKRVKTLQEARKIYKEVEEIIYLGDILFPLGDVINRNAELVRPGYVEEWWELELLKKINITGEKLNDLYKNKFRIEFEKALEISEKYSIPLHPHYIYYWTQISFEGFFGLIEWLQNGVLRGEKLILPYEKALREKFKTGKRALEILGVEHEVVLDNVVISNDLKSFLFNLGIDAKDGEYLKDYANKIIKIKDKANVLEIVNSLCRFKVKDKAGDFIGTRMGRPEKAKLRKLTGSPNVLFPIAEQGGRLRSVQEAVKVGFIKAELPIYKCECGNETIYRLCENCGKETKKEYYCFECRQVKEEKCKDHERSANYSLRKIDSKHFFDKAIEMLGYERYEVPELIKGVRGTSSSEHDFENVAKGILRAKHNLCVNKDGTIRYDGTEIPVTHFKPKEVGTSVEKLKELGYELDFYGQALENEEQILELMPHDIILPACPISPDEKADDVFFNISKFIDEELERFYKLPKYYNLKSKEDLVGQLVACMAPHNCAGVIGRIVGFNHLQGLTASPYMHAAMRRDCFYPSTGLIFEKNGQIQREFIGDYIEGLILKGAKVKRLDQYTERIEVAELHYAYGLDIKTSKLKKKKIKYFIKASKPNKWIKIITRSGRQQIMTDRHDFFYINNGKFDIKKAEEIRVGDKLAVLDNYRSFVGEAIFHKEFGNRKLNSNSLEKKGDYFIDVVDKVSEFEEDVNSYCFDVENKERLDKNVLWGEGIINFRCDGDEAAVMMLMDVLINFSRKFLPAHRGGTQDAPLVLNAKIQAGEVDDQILDFETCSSYPLEMYEAAELKKHSSEVKIETVKTRLKKDMCPFSNIGFTHDSSNVNESVVNSSYKILPTMKEKVGNQMDLVLKIRAVDTDDVARLIIERHFIRDIRGNLRKFSHQQFRCVKCNEKFRRPPLAGVCNKCGGKIIFTISHGSIIKYLEPAIDLATNFKISEYTRQGLELTKIYIESIFGREKDKQVELKAWF